MSVCRPAAAATVAVAVFLGLVACTNEGSPVVAPAPGRSTTVPTTVAGTGATTSLSPTTTSGRPVVAGFGSVAYRVQGSAVAQRCALLAETAAQQGRGLMDPSVLPGYDGMLFVFPSDTTTRFWMKDTPMPLSIAWFDASGRFVSTADMEPCLDKPDCPLYAAAAPYRYALEVTKGGLSGLGIGPGATITVGGACT